MGTTSKVFKKFGSYLKDSGTGAQIIVPKNMKVTHNFMTGTSLDPEVFINIKWVNKLTESSFGQKCVICGTSNKIEMHHLRSIADVRARYRAGNMTYRQ